LTAHTYGSSLAIPQQHTLDQATTGQFQQQLFCAIIALLMPNNVTHP
jgi:hypothetical protein